MARPVIARISLNYSELEVGDQIVSSGLYVVRVFRTGNTKDGLAFSDGTKMYNNNSSWNSGVQVEFIVPEL